MGNRHRAVGKLQERRLRAQQRGYIRLRPARHALVTFCAGTSPGAAPSGGRPAWADMHDESEALKDELGDDIEWPSLAPGPDHGDADCGAKAEKKLLEKKLQTWKLLEIKQLG